MKKLNKLMKIFMFLGLIVLGLTACSEKEYVINFESNGGTKVNQIVLAAGKKLTKPENPTKEESKFLYWCTDPYLQEEYVWPEVMPSESFNLYAKWTERDRKLTFESNGGSVVEPIYAPALSKLDMPEDPTMKNRLFAGWFIDEDYEISFDNVMPINDLTVYAKWVNVEPTTSLALPNNWSSGDASAYNIIQAGNETTIQVLADKGTYSYVGIEISTNIKEYSTFVMEVAGTKDEEVLLKCQNGGVVTTEKKFVLNGKEDQKLIWTVLPENLTDGKATMNFYIFIRPGKTGGVGTTFTIKGFNLYRLRGENESYQSVIHFDTLGGSGVESIFADENANIEEPTTIPDKAGYTFKGWYTTKDLEEKFVFDKMPKGQTTLYAKWQSNAEVRLVFDSNDGTPVDPIILPAGANINEYIPDEPTKTGALFGGWYLDQEFINQFDWSAMPEEDSILYARWVVIEENTSILLSNDVTTTEKYIINKNDDGTVTVSIDAGKTTYSMFGTKLLFNSKDYQYFRITFTGTKDKQILFKLQNGGVKATEVKVMMTGEKQIFEWKVAKENLPDGTLPMDFYICLDPGKKHDVKPAEDIYVTIESIKLFRVITENTSEQNVIHFITNGGSSVQPIFGNTGDDITIPNPNKAGYNFVGWYKDSELTEKFEQATMPESNMILYAGWTEKTDINPYVFTNENWTTVAAYNNYTLEIVDGKVAITYNHLENKWNAGAGAAYEFRGLNSDKIHFTKLKISFKLTETTKTEDIYLRFRFFGINENYTYSGSKTPTLQYLVANADLNKDMEITLNFSLITNSAHMAHLKSLLESENFNMLVNAYTKTSSPSYGVGTLVINSIQFC